MRPTKDSTLASQDSVKTGEGYIVEVIVCMLGNTIPNEVVFFAKYRIAKISHDANLSRTGNAKEMRKK